MVRAQEHLVVPRPRTASCARAAAVPAATGVALALALLLVARVLLADPGPVPLVHADEAGYLGNARRLFDGAGGTGNGYFAGYSLLLAPAAAVAGDPLRFYALALVTNAFVLAASGVLAALVVRRLFPGATNAQVIAAVVVVFVQPASFAAAGLAMSENAMFAVTLAATWLVASVADPDDHRRLAAAGAVAGFAYWVSPRGVVVAVAFAVALVAAARGRLGRAALAPAFGALVVSAASGHVFNAVVASGSGTAGLSARRTGLLDALAEPSLWPELGARLTGRVSYVGVTTLGLAVVGCAVGLGLLLADPRRGGGYGRRAAGGFAALAVVLTLVADAVTLDAGAVPRPIHYVYYGRYTEAVALPAVVIGTGWLLDRARDARRLRLAGVMLVTGLLASAALAHLLTPRTRTSPAVVVSNVIGLFPLRRLVGSTSLTTELLVGIAVVAAAYVAFSVHRSAGALIALALLAGASFDVHRHFFETGWSQRSGEATLADAIGRVERAGVPAGCIRVSVGAQWWHVNNYRFLLPRSRFERARTTTTRECGPVLVADRLPDDVPGEGLVVALEHAAGLALTVSADGLDPGTRDRLAAEGLVLPGPMCAPLPGEAYRAVLTARVAPPATRGGQVAARVEIRHAGERAPWVAGAPVPGAGCGRVRLAAEHLGERGDVVATEMFDLPRTLFPGDHVTVELPVTPGAEDAALRFGLVHEGVTWFRDRGAADAVVPVPVTP